MRVKAGAAATVSASAAPRGGCSTYETRKDERGSQHSGRTRQVQLCLHTWRCRTCQPRSTAVIDSRSSSMEGLHTRLDRGTAARAARQQ
jgi:hypothetical protein